jgi:hypothetical protein
MGSCGGGTTEPNPPGSVPNAITIAAGDGQITRINSATAVLPAVKVTASGGGAVAGIPVTFTVASGGGNVTGGTATTDANGVATVGSWLLGPSVGDQTLTASVATNGVAPATIHATGRLPYWTFLVYMAADNDLAIQGVFDIDEMEAAGVDPEVQVVVQAEFSPQQFALVGCTAQCIGRPNFNTFRYTIAQGTPRDGPDGPVVDLGGNRDMTSTAELREFVTWGRAQYPAERTLVVLWNHGGGYVGLLQDVTSASGGLMSLGQLQPALTGLSLDILAFDMCLMAGYETLESITGLAQYAAFSEETIPGEGFPYEALLNAIQQAPTTDGRGVAQLITSTYHTSYQGQRPSTTISAYDLGQYASFRTALGSVAQLLTDNLATLGPAIANAAVTGQKYTYSELTDLVTFIDSLAVRTTNQVLLTQLSSLRSLSVSGFRIDNRARNGDGVALGSRGDVLRSTGLHVVLPTGLEDDQFFAGGAKSLESYQSLYPGLPWTAFLTAWTTGQATTPFVDQGDDHLEIYLAWSPDAAATGTDIDLWLVEPSGNLYIPFLGTVTPNGDFTPESADVGAAYEGWLTRQHLELGTYYFYANLWADPASVDPIVQFYYRNDQVSPLTALYAPGTEPHLSEAPSWLEDETPSFGEADNGNYGDLVLVAFLEVTPEALAATRRQDSAKGLQSQVVGQASVRLQRPGASQSAVRSVAGLRYSTQKTVTPALTAAQLATARQRLSIRASRQPMASRSIRGLP